MAEITIEFPADVPPGAAQEVQKIAEKYGAYIVQDEPEIPGEPLMEEGPPPMPPGAAGDIMGAKGAFGLRPPGIA